MIHMTKSFVCFWEGDKKLAKERANRVLKPIGRYHKGAKKVLELGVGIGAVLENFPKRFEVYGLDIKKEYIDVCKERIKRGKFFVSSMHNFSLGEKFDVIFSVYDSINFLETLGQWKSTFEAVYAHLVEKGLFIFDMYTPKVLEHFKRRRGTARKISKGYEMEWAIIKGNTLTWDFKIFEKITEDTYQINEYLWKETIYSVPKVKSALTKHFEILQTKRWEDGRRILFVCRKK
jgi:cyclopropane fatty-acyl-phospholipid synthase-like methyltransferase